VKVWETFSLPRKKKKTAIEAFIEKYIK